MEYMIMPLMGYADFQGRSRRKEYWMFQLGIILMYIVAAILVGIVGAVLGETASSIVMLPLLLVVLGIIVPSLAVTVRRLHDQDRSGWWILINFVPFGGIVLLVFMFLEGTNGPNQYGPDPKDPYAEDVFS
jgi:uncharacterized membrane protein YhaH (DUF805 family)